MVTFAEFETRAQTFDEKLRADHEEAMRSRDCDDLVSELLKMYGELHDIVATNPPSTPQVMVQACKAQLAFLEAGKAVDAFAKTFEVASFDIQRITELRRIMSDLFFAKGAMEATIRRLAEVTPDTLLPSDDFFARLRQRKCPTTS